MAPAMPRPDAPPSAPLLVDSLAIVANMPKELEITSVRIATVEDENRHLEDEILKIRSERF